MEQRRTILGVRRENPVGFLSEEVKLHPINSFGEEAEQETRVRFSISNCFFGEKETEEEEPETTLVKRRKDMMRGKKKMEKRTRDFGLKPRGLSY